MSAPGEAVAAAAEALVGSPFRLHGRDPASGVDCVGLVAYALAAAGARPVAPAGYGLRNLGITQWLPLAKRSGLIPTNGEALRRGDVVLITLAHCQHHLVIGADSQNVIHAHAGLRRVVRQPMDPDWQIGAKWRAAPVTEG
jgi:cell wall-associated NlpC family hydrolase